MMFTNVPHKDMSMRNFLCRWTVPMPTVGLVWQPVRHPLIGLHQQPFKNVTPSTCIANSTHCHNDPSQCPFSVREVHVDNAWCISDKRDIGIASFCLKVCFIHGWTPVTTTGLHWLQPRFFNATTRLELSFFHFCWVYLICGKLGSYDIYMLQFEGECEIYDLICFNYSILVWIISLITHYLVSLFCKPPSL